MSKVNIVTEMVNNHSTEEVIGWLASIVGPLPNKMMGQVPEIGAEVVLGETLSTLGTVAAVLKGLDNKLSRKNDGPVVA